MSDDKIGNKTGSEGLSETDKGYYEDLYNDLPKEVVDILMQTHPLMGKNDDLEATAYRTPPPETRGRGGGQGGEDAAGRQRD